MIPITPIQTMLPSTASAPVENAPGERPALRAAATAFEAAFLTEMLSHAQLGATGGGIGDGGYDGGEGGDAFASMLTREWATKMAGQGGVGLSDAIYRSLLASETSHG